MGSHEPEGSHRSWVKKLPFSFNPPDLFSGFKRKVQAHDRVRCTIHPSNYIHFLSFSAGRRVLCEDQREILSFSGCQIYLYVRNHLWGPSPFGRFTWFTLRIRCSKCSLYYWLERACYSMRPGLLVSRDWNPLIVATRSIFLLLVSLLHKFIF